MHHARAELFRDRVAQCFAAAKNVKDPTIKQAYIELAQAWRVLAEEIERLRAQARRPRIFSATLPPRSLDDFYELRPANADRRAAAHVLEHPTLGGRSEAAAPDDAASLAPPRRPTRRA